MSKYIDKDTAKPFYKMQLHPGEYGVKVFTTTFFSIHETECFNFCVNEFALMRMNGYGNLKNESQTAKAKRALVKVHRVAKVGSRVAFDSKQKAYDHLIFMKKRHVRHLQRDIELIGLSLKALLNSTFEEMKPDLNGNIVIDGTKETVLEHYTFN